MDNIQTHDDLRELGCLAAGIARQAGALLLEGWRDVHAVGTKSSPSDLVTQMDREAEALIRRRIAQARPRDRVLGEEEGESPGDGRGARWIVDPLDGTVNYFYGLPAWVVSIAVEIDGHVVVGAVNAPALGEDYLAVAGQGSHRTSVGKVERLAVSAVTDMREALLATGFGYRCERRAAQARVVAELLPEVRDIRRCGAAALDLCWTAGGRVDCYYERGLNLWDWAAGGLIVREAGGLVGGLRGRPGDTEMVVAGPAPLFTQLSDRLAGLEADSG
ncbi:MAG: inositol monophosphatase family protein [Candidatus Nanopelagicales bacterium]|nr:inositol monophosphatase family protein [Candidatus Nanopelagicales bacterium]